jgi:hypothetical protein
MIQFIFTRKIRDKYHLEAVTAQRDRVDPVVAVQVMAIFLEYIKNLNLK